MARFVDSKIDFENMSKNKNTSKSTTRFSFYKNDVFSFQHGYS